MIGIKLKGVLCAGGDRSLAAPAPTPQTLTYFLKQDLPAWQLEPCIALP